MSKRPGKRRILLQPRVAVRKSSGGLNSSIQRRFQKCLLHIITEAPSAIAAPTQRQAQKILFVVPLQQALVEAGPDPAQHGAVRWRRIDLRDEIERHCTVTMRKAWQGFGRASHLTLLRNSQLSKRSNWLNLISSSIAILPLTNEDGSATDGREHARPHLLIVNDVADNRRILTRRFERRGFRHDPGGIRISRHRA